MSVIARLIPWLGGAAVRSEDFNWRNQRWFQAMVSVWTSMPTYLIVGFMGVEFIRLLSWRVERRDPSKLRLVALVAAKVTANPHRLNSSATLNRSFSSQRV